MKTEKESNPLLEAFEDVDFTPTPLDIYETTMKRALMEKMANRFKELKEQGLSEEAEDRMPTSLYHNVQAWIGKTLRKIAKVNR